LPACAFFCVRGALTQLYEEELRLQGGRATQFTILRVLSRAGKVSQGPLGGMLAMDSIPLTHLGHHEGAWMDRGAGGKIGENEGCG